MRFFIVCVFLSLCALHSYPQRAKKIMIAVHGDLIRTDNDGFFEKLQAGVEGSFYFSRKFAATGGAEWWSGNKVIAVPGVRFCPIDEAFIRMRALIHHDVSIGGGFTKPISDDFRIEAMGDFYFRGHIAIRVGIAYGIGRRP